MIGEFTVIHGVDFAIQKFYMLTEGQKEKTNGALTSSKRKIYMYELTKCIEVFQQEPQWTQRLNETERFIDPRICIDA